MKSAIKWTLALAMITAVLLHLPQAQGQLRTRSGAKESVGIRHPKDLERRVFQLTNEARRKNGLPPLEQDETLRTLAREKSDDMIKRHYFSHPDPEGKTITEHYAEKEPAKPRMQLGVGENICMGGRSDYHDTETAARQIVDGFMVSPGHRKNILEPAYSHLGVGVSVKGKEFFATQSFGASLKKKP